MPKVLHENDIVHGNKGTYRVVDNKSFEGGQGIGYFVENESDTKLFLKMFMEPTARNPNAKDFVNRQQVLLKKLAEIPDFVCQDIEFFETGGIFYKVSERMEGITLQDRLDQAAANPTPEFWPQTNRQVNATVLAFTIAQIHEHGLAHLDLKPENCFLAERVIEATGQKRLIVRLLDFDGAMVAGAPEPFPILGTPNYWSPEHVEPAKFGQPGQHSDVFTLGIMLYELLARRYPFVSERNFLSQAAEHPRKVAPWLPDHIADIMWQAINPQPAARPKAQEIHQALIRRKTEPPALKPPVPDRKLMRVALITPSRRIRFWEGKDPVLGRDTLRGIAGYQDVSRYQARIFKDASGWVITSLGSPTHSTKLNGSVIESGTRYPLGEGDVIEIGRLSVTVAFEYET